MLELESSIFTPDLRHRDTRVKPAHDELPFFWIILCPRKNPKIQESCKNKAIRRTGPKGQLKNARRNKNRLGFNLPPPSLCFFGFSNGLSIEREERCC